MHGAIRSGAERSVASGRSRRAVSLNFENLIIYSSGRKQIFRLFCFCFSLRTWNTWRAMMSVSVVARWSSSKIEFHSKKWSRALRTRYPRSSSANISAKHTLHSPPVQSLCSLQRDTRCLQYPSLGANRPRSRKRSQQPPPLSNRNNARLIPIRTSMRPRHAPTCLVPALLQSTHPPVAASHAKPTQPYS